MSQENLPHLLFPAADQTLMVTSDDGLSVLDNSHTGKERLWMMSENTEQKNVTAQKIRASAPFIKRNSDVIVKMLVHQFGLTVFGFLLYSAAKVSGNSALVIGFGVFSAVFYLFLLYVLSWENGAKDKIRIDAGRQKYDRLKGAKANLAANIPNLVFAVLAIVGYLFINKNVLSAEGNFISPAWAVNLYAVAQVVGVYLNSMYIGIGDYIGISTQPYYLFIVCIPSVLVCGIGYYLGTKEKFGVFSSAK